MCLFVSIKYHLRFNEDRKFMELSNTNINLLPKKERESVNKVIKVNNDYSKQKETLTNKILENEMCKYTIEENEYE